LIEFERGRPIIVDRPLYRELVKEAIKRTHAELEVKATAAAEEKSAARRNTRPADPVSVAKRERDAQLRELTDQAHGANVDLGVSLIHHLAAVEPDDLDVARFFVLCGRRHRTNYADRLTMWISRAVRQETARRGRGAAKTRSGQPRGEEEDGHQSALIDPLSRGRGSADAGGSRARRRSLPRGGYSACGIVDTLVMADEAGASGRRPALLPFVPCERERRFRRRACCKPEAAVVLLCTPNPA
jgi:hypothetical protein